MHRKDYLSRGFLAPRLKISTSGFLRGIIGFDPGAGLPVLVNGACFWREMIEEIMSDGLGAGGVEVEGGEADEGCGLGFEMEAVDGCASDTGRELAWGGRAEAAGLLAMGRDAGLLDRAGGGDEDVAWDCGLEEAAGRSSNKS